MSVRVSYTPEAILFNLWNTSNLPVLAQELIFTMLMAAKNVVAYTWGKRAPPLLEH